MISNETLEKLARQYQTTIFPNIVREYFQHVFLSELYKLPESEKMLFKGGTALRIIYGSSRFSEDLDFSIFRIEQRIQKKFIENLFTAVLSKIEEIGVKVELGPKLGPTTEGYYGDATFQMHDYPLVLASINVSSRNGRDIKGEVDSVANDFVPTYNLIHLPQNELVSEKIFDALLKRKKARDFYDLYWIMKKGMLAPDQKQRLAGIKNEIIAAAKNIDFQGELGVFLPADQQAIIRDFIRALEAELNRQIA